jgi:hypothetical protein
MIGLVLQRFDTREERLNLIIGNRGMIAKDHHKYSDHDEGSRRNPNQSLEVA